MVVNYHFLIFCKVKQDGGGHSQSKEPQPLVGPQFWESSPPTGLMSIVKHVFLVINLSNRRSQGEGVGFKVGIYVHHRSLHAF
jgi:hypothetical protein